MPQIVSLVYQPDRSLYEAPYRYNRVRADRLMLIEGHGIEGDFKAGSNPNRQVNILSYETTQAMLAEGFKTLPGELGEQIVISGLDVHALPGDTILQLGESAQLQVTSVRTPCSWFELIQSKSMEDARGRVGIMARVIASGTIGVGDRVTLITT